MMQLTDLAHDQVMAFIYHNVVVLPETGRVIGVLLGNSVYGWDGQLKAKYFNNTLFSLKGLILAKVKMDNKTFAVDTDKVIEDGWQLISKIKDHASPNIKPENEWAPGLISEHFGVPA